MRHETNEYGFFKRESKVERGERVNCNEYEGTITKVCDGQLTGMVEVHLRSGYCCVPISDLRHLDTVPAANRY